MSAGAADGRGLCVHINRVVAHHLLGSRGQQCGIQHGCTILALPRSCFNSATRTSVTATPSTPAPPVEPNRKSWLSVLGWAGLAHLEVGWRHLPSAYASV